MGAFTNSPVIVDLEKRMVVVGSVVVCFHPEMTGESITKINGKCYIDGYQLIGEKWEKTFSAWWYKRRSKK